MSRARNIKPGLWKNEQLAECSIWARYIFPGLWTIADRDGRLEDRPKRIKAELLPFDTQDVEPLLRELEQAGFLERYEVGGCAYIQICNFAKHQTPHYSEKKSVIKPPPFLEITATIEPNNSEKDAVIKPPENPEHSERQRGLKRGAQRPDSLIHRLSDSPNPDSTKRTPTVTPTTADASLLTDNVPEPIRPSRAVELSVLLRKLNVTITFAHPLADEWGRKGVTDEQAREAVGLARVHKPTGPISPNYLAPIIAEMLNPAAKQGNGLNGTFIPQWWTSEALTDRQAKLIGTYPAKPAESWDQYRARITSKLQQLAADHANQAA